MAVDSCNLGENWFAWHPRSNGYQERLRHARVCSEERADLVTGPAGPHHRIAAYLAAINYGEGMSSRPVNPFLQESAPRRGEVSPIIGINALEGKNTCLDDVLWLWKIHAQSLEAKVAANKPESAAGIIVLHVKHAV